MTSLTFITIPLDFIEKGLSLTIDAKKSRTLYLIL
jgi:hypothetical protein